MALDRSYQVLLTYNRAISPRELPIVSCYIRTRYDIIPVRKRANFLVLIRITNQHLRVPVVPAFNALGIREDSAISASGVLGTSEDSVISAFNTMGIRGDSAFSAFGTLGTRGDPVTSVFGTLGIQEDSSKSAFGYPGNSVFQQDSDSRVNG